MLKSADYSDIKYLSVISFMMTHMVMMKVAVVICMLLYGCGSNACDCNILSGQVSASSTQYTVLVITKLLTKQNKQTKIHNKNDNNNNPKTRNYFDFIQKML